MELCHECGVPLDDNGTTNCGLATACERDRAVTSLRIEAAMRAYTLPMLDAISKNEMPECFAFTRDAGVAIAKMLLLALEQNQEMAERLRSMHAPEKPKLH